MIRYATKVRIERPPREVIALLTDQDRYGEWTDMVDVRFDTSEPRVGTRGTFRIQGFPITGPLAMEIVELAPDSRVVIQVEHPALDWRSISDVTRTPTGSELLYAGEIRLRGWRRLLEPLMAREIRRGEQAEAERLKAILEHDGRP